MAATYVRASEMSDDMARKLGEHHGYNAANFAACVSGEDLDTLDPDRTEPLGLTDRARMFYRDGYDRGIDEFKIDDMDRPDDESDDSAYSPAFIP